MGNVHIDNYKYSEPTTAYALYDFRDKPEVIDAIESCVNLLEIQTPGIVNLPVLISLIKDTLTNVKDLNKFTLKHVVERSPDNGHVSSKKEKAAARVIFDWYDDYFTVQTITDHAKYILDILSNSDVKMVDIPDDIQMQKICLFRCPSDLTDSLIPKSPSFNIYMVQGTDFLNWVSLQETFPIENSELGAKIMVWTPDGKHFDYASTYQGSGIRIINTKFYSRIFPKTYEFIKEVL